MGELLLGDEAVALAAIHAGIAGAFSYPGTPSTEVFEFVQRHPLCGRYISARWSANEKVAYEEALGMSFAGKRALVSMKHVGLNVAADPFMSSALTGAHAGLVLVVADDPGMHSSQNEQDSRYYGQFAKTLIFEAGDQQEAYDMTREAFEISEKVRLPVMIRLVTRLAHSRSVVHPRQPIEPADLGKALDWRKWTLLPVNARRRFRRLLDLQGALEAYAGESRFNHLVLRGARGIVAGGLAGNYVREATKDDGNDSILKIGVYPLPRKLFHDLVDHCSEILVVEEGYPFIESQLRGLLGIPGKRIRGKLDGTLPPDGELGVEVVRSALSGLPAGKRVLADDLALRPPQLCAGCAHCDTFRAIMAAVEPIGRPFLFSDIGCYTLAALPPLSAIDTCVDMGASVSMGIGAAKAGAHPVICTIGDSTFIHSGMSALIGAAHDDLNMTVIILDNATVAMTGAQEVFATGEDFVRLMHGLGVRSEHVIPLRPTPGEHGQNVDAIRREVNHRGLSVIVASRPCIQLKARRRKEQTKKQPQDSVLTPS